MGPASPAAVAALRQLARGDGLWGPPPALAAARAHRGHHRTARPDAKQRTTRKFRATSRARTTLAIDDLSRRPYPGHVPYIDEHDSGVCEPGSRVSYSGCRVETLESGSA